MNVSIYDTNPDDWAHQEFNAAAPIGPEAALEWLASQNSDSNALSPMGPTKFYGDQERFCLESAWSGGRQWYRQLVVFSRQRLTQTELDQLLADSGIETDDDDPEDNE
jgi:hypothetical protein